MQPFRKDYPSFYLLTALLLRPQQALLLLSCSWDAVSARVWTDFFLTSHNVLRSNSLSRQSSTTTPNHFGPLQLVTTASPTWIPGTVTKVTGPFSYYVELESGRAVRRHVDAIRSRNIRVTVPVEASPDDLYLPDVLSPDPIPHVAPPGPAPPPAPPTAPPPPPRLSARLCQPPDRLGW